MDNRIEDESDGGSGGFQILGPWAILRVNVENSWDSGGAV